MKSFLRAARRLSAVAAWSLAFVAAGAARAEPVALTFDDLPTMSLDGSPDYAARTTDRLLARLRRERLPAIGFVIGGQLEGAKHAPGERVLKKWLDRGFELGNHTWSHESFNKTPVADYIADVESADQVIRPILARRGQAPRWFRHPYLETGATLDDKHAFEAWLAQHGYRVAPVTMENSDWLFSPVYDDAIRRHDRKRAREVRKIYLDYTARVVPWYREAGLDLFGRRPAFVFLLHATRLNADVLPRLNRILKDNDLQPVSLEAAMRDPAYATSDDWADPEGDEWLDRWAHILGRQLPWDSFPEPPADIAAEAERLDPT